MKLIPLDKINPDDRPFIEQAIEPWLDKKYEKQMMKVAVLLSKSNGFRMDVMYTFEKNKGEWEVTIHSIGGKPVV
jgi:hypothetical protein